MIRNDIKWLICKSQCRLFLVAFRMAVRLMRNPFHGFICTVAWIIPSNPSVAIVSRSQRFICEWTNLQWHVKNGIRTSAIMTNKPQISIKTPGTFGGNGVVTFRCNLNWRITTWWHLRILAMICDVLKWLAAQRHAHSNQHWIFHYRK